VDVSRFAARDRLLSAIARQLPVEGLLRELLSALHEVAGFEACALVITDPETTLPTGGMVENFSADSPDICAQVWDNELLDPDFNKFNMLARSTDAVASLWEVTDGDLDRSPRYVKVYEPRGIGDELRMAFTYGGMCWAVGALMRVAVRGPFPAEEIRAVRDLVPVSARALYRSTTGGGQHWRIGGPGHDGGRRCRSYRVDDPGCSIGAR
jgi:hypothetical protein